MLSQAQVGTILFSDLRDALALLILATFQEFKAAAVMKSQRLRGREKVEREFDEQIVICKYLSAIEEVLATRTR